MTRSFSPFTSSGVRTGRTSFQIERAPSGRPVISSLMPVFSSNSLKTFSPIGPRVTFFMWS